MSDGNGEWPAEPAERVREMVEEVLDELDLEGEVEISEDDDRIDVVVNGEDDYGLLIGKRGQTLRWPELQSLATATVETVNILGVDKKTPTKFRGVLVRDLLDRFEADPQVHEAFTKYRKTHNDGVFDAYTPEIMKCRKSGIITGLPDAYGRGRIIGDYRRVALYGVERLLEAKRAERQRNLRFECERRVAATEQELEPLIGENRVVVHRILRLRVEVQQPRSLGKGALTPNAVDRPVARRDGQPSAGARGRREWPSNPTRCK